MLIDIHHARSTVTCATLARVATAIGNPCWPIEPGTRWTFRETTPYGEVMRVVITVTTETKMIANGVDGAQAGIVMPADPAPGQAYRQEYFAGEAEDNGQIVSVTEITDSPFGHFEDVVMTRDTITIEPDVVQFKFYAYGVGPMLVLDVSGGAGGREELLTVDTVPAGSGLGPLGQPD